MRYDIVSRTEWLAARATLLEKEKVHTRAQDALTKARRQMPWVRVEQDYIFTGPDGEVSFADAFLDRSQLAIYHLMFGPGWDAPCIGCSQWAQALNGTTATFKQADARLIAISRAPYEEISQQQSALGWQFTWLSSFGSTFNYDYFVSNEDQGALSATEIGGPGGEKVEFDRGENHGVSVFTKSPEGEIFHTYSAYNRGIEPLNGAFGYYDLLPKGRPW